MSRVSRRPTFDPAAAVTHLAASDRKLGALIAKVGACRLVPGGIQSPFDALAEAIVYQQLHAKAASTIHGRVAALFGGRFGADDIAAADEKALRACGLSNAKMLALKDLAARAIAGRVPSVAQLRRMDDDAIVERLTEIRGIGRWTVEMMLIFRLGRPDVLPVGDYGVRKGYARAFGTGELPTPRALGEHGERWRPFRTVASWYLWRANELP